MRKIKNKKIECSIGVCAYNEEKNIEKLLVSLIGQKLLNVEIVEILVISSGSTDRTAEIVRKYSKIDRRVRLIMQTAREGKSSAVNLFIREARSYILVLIGGDLLIKPNVVEKLVSKFKDPEIGMVGAHPVPVNNMHDGLWSFAGNLVWELHHRVALRSPKMGEVVAFRKIFYRIPTLYGLDEPNIEPLIKGQGFKLKYVPDAIVLNRSPGNLKEFIKQRRRNISGQIALIYQQGYKTATFNTPLLILVFVQLLAENPKPKFLLYSLIVVPLEIYCRFLGWWDYKVANKRYVMWDIIESTKNLRT